MAQLKCSICDSVSSHRRYTVREMMFGFGDEFEYFECCHCGCLQIKQMPPNIEKYYPENYYSFSDSMISTPSLFKRYLKQLRLRYFLGEKTVVGKLIFKYYGDRHLPQWPREVGLKVSDDILDVGCGKGQMLLSLNSAGFDSLTGIDPYIEEDISYPCGVRVLKKEVWDLNQQFDFIILNHSFEHMSNPTDVLESLHEILRPHSYLLIRIPIVSSYAWQKYTTNWVQLDAPRHLFLHSVESIEHLAKRTNFVIENIVYDSTEFQFLGSEQYVEDIPLFHPRSFKTNIDDSIFNEQDILKFTEKARRLNEEGKGDQAAFYLRRT